jgi:hypothetical protein
LSAESKNGIGVSRDRLPKSTQARLARREAERSTVMSQVASLSNAVTRSLVWTALGAALLLPAPAAAEDKIPAPLAQEVLIKTSLLTLNDANVTGNYTVLHAKLAKPVREQFNPDKLKQAFKEFADQKIDFEIVAAKAPIATKDARIDERGALQLRGYFDAAPSRVTYELDFIPSEGEWKPLKLNVDFKPASEK